LFAHYFRLNLAGFRLRILRIESNCACEKRLTREQDQNPLKNFKWCISWKTGSPCFPLFSKLSTRNFFLLPILRQTERVLRIFFNMTYTVKSYYCYFILGSYFSEYGLMETYKANNLQCVTSIGQLKALGFLWAFEESADCALLSYLRWFKLPHIYIQMTTLHMWNKQGINRKILIGNRFHVTLYTMHRQSLHRIQIV